MASGLPPKICPGSLSMASRPDATAMALACIAECWRRRKWAAASRRIAKALAKELSSVLNCRSLKRQVTTTRMHAEPPTLPSSPEAPAKLSSGQDIAVGPAGRRAGATPDSKSLNASSLARVSSRNNRILVVDDNPSIHDDFLKVLGAAHDPQPDLVTAEVALFGDNDAPVISADFEIDSA